ncbi:retropepsin-like aspartic protease [Aestuariivivens sediminicola]|uniref:retropepsin-like aspartic protease n=1 Tax=Aestuariivivens sediminicola TaxID=2913560 RepID=UPI001F5AB0FB|nr:retropepsin-like aspartic protease [Aestuariivivens sediminicola]
MVRQVLSSIFLLVCFNFVLGQKTTFKTGKPTDRTYYTQIAYENIGGKLIVPVVINDKMYKFLFDTGAPNLISTAIASDIVLKDSKSISVSDANQKKQLMNLATIPFLTIGNVTFKNTSALVFMDTNNLVFDCYEVDGIIGSNLLRKSIVQIRPKERIIILTNDRKKIEIDTNKGVDLMLRGNQSSPYISIKLKSKKSAKEDVLIDTGASGFYDMCKANYRVLERHEVLQPVASGLGTSSIGLFGNSDQDTQYQVKIPEIEIDGHTFKNIATITSGDDNSRLGSDIFEYGDLTLDFIRKRVYFHPFASESNLMERHLGLTPTIENNKLVVGMIWDDSLLETVNLGDEIVKVNAIDVTQLNICKLLTEHSPFKTSEILDITLINKSGNTYSLTLKKY